MGLEIRPVTDVAAWLREMRGHDCSVGDETWDGGLEADDDEGFDDAGGADYDDVPLVALHPRPTADDVAFVLDLARRVVRDTRDDPRIEPGQARPRQVAGWTARGTHDVLLWALGATDVGPSGIEWHGAMRDDGLRADDTLLLEWVVTGSSLRATTTGTQDWHFLTGVRHGVRFARGSLDDYWWAPLPEQLRRTPLRDEIGRRAG